MNLHNYDGLALRRRFYITVVDSKFAIFPGYSEKRPISGKTDVNSFNTWNLKGTVNLFSYDS